MGFWVKFGPIYKREKTFTPNSPNGYITKSLYLIIIYKEKRCHYVLATQLATNANEE